MTTPVEVRQTSYRDNLGIKRTSANILTLRDFIAQQAFEYRCRNMMKYINFRFKYDILDEIKYH